MAGVENTSSNSVPVSESIANEPDNAVVEWCRSCEQVENGVPSTSLFWDSDDDYDGPKPSELYGKFTWNVENFSTLSKRELRSNVFEVGGYKWYILIYPQGCDVCNHLSLFLCVANHEKLLPGWSHFAQFTIAVENKDPKKSKYSDTLHRFWKKEHDWGWKKFMELSKVLDGFIVADTLVINAQVQVIREKAHSPFRCLDNQYSSELIRVYSTNVEQICRRFVEDRRGKLSKLIEDKIRWSSFRAFWLGINQNIRRHLSRDRSDTILKLVVKHFFIEKEVTSTLVMDSLYNGLKTFECQGKYYKRRKLLELEEPTAPLVFVERDMFVLADDVLPLLQRATSEPLPHQPLLPKDDKGSQNRMKDGSGAEFNKDSTERDEWCLTELGRRTVEMFVLTHIFGKRIEVAYQEAVALKRQEELIREEEEAGHVENELKAKHGCSDKEKRSKKKQAKKRSGQKSKDRCRDSKPGLVMQEKNQSNGLTNEKSLRSSSPEGTQLLDKAETLEVAFSDTGGEVVEAMQPDLEGREMNTVNWGGDEIHTNTEVSGSVMQNGHTERSPSIMDDSSSTCSTDSVPSVVSNGTYRANSLSNNKRQTSPKRRCNQNNKEISEQNCSHGGAYMLSEIIINAGIPDSVKAQQSEQIAVATSLKEDRNRSLDPHLFEEEKVVSEKKIFLKNQADVFRSSKQPPAELSSSPSPAEQQPKHTSERNLISSNIIYPVFGVTEPSASSIQAEKPISLATRSHQLSSKAEPQMQTKPAKSIAPHVTDVSRPLSAPLIPCPKAPTPAVLAVQAMPFLSRSVSAAGRLGTSYRNAIMSGSPITANPSGFSHPSLSSTRQAAVSSSEFSLSSLVCPPQPSPKADQSTSRPSITFGSVLPARALHVPYQQSENDLICLLKNNKNDVKSDSELNQQQHKHETSSASSRCGGLSEDFPHLDIINYLLDEEGHENSTNGQHNHRGSCVPASVATAEFASSSSSSGLDQPKQYYDGFYQPFYATHLSQADLPIYVESPINGLPQSQWPYICSDISDMSLLDLGTQDANAYLYKGPNYPSLARGGNKGHTLYRPTTGI